MYTLLARVPQGLDRLRALFEEHVKKQGLLSVEKVLEGGASGTADGKDNEDDEDGGNAAGSSTAIAPPRKKKDKSDMDPKVYVEALLSIHKRYSEMVSSCFAGEPGFVASLDKAVREFVNRNAVCKNSSSKSPELLAKFCDSLLRKSSKVSEETEVEDLLNSVVCCRFKILLCHR